MRYIDADRLKDEMLKTIRAFNDHNVVYDGADALLTVKYQPTADVVEVVRCKDCKYWNNETDLTYCEKKVWLGTDATDYCSFGERADT